MKKTGITLFLIAIIMVIIAVGTNTTSTNNEYLRIHIRANSNSKYDQSIKMDIKDVVVNYLTPLVAECDSKSKAISMLNNEQKNLEKVINNELKLRGYSYKSNVKIANEKFPVRVYENVTLGEGFYDAVIVELGNAEGDNWWCVVYPPLCFTSGEKGIEYKSKIMEIIEKFFKNKQ